MILGNPALAGMGLNLFAAIPFFANNTITYTGAAAPLLLQLANLSPQDRQAVKVINVQVVGDVVQESNICCMIMNMVAAGFCIFPAFTICCSCFQRAIG